jgi:imidazolonepropionase-like amidohydrolase
MDYLMKSPKGFNSFILQIFLIVLFQFFSFNLNAQKSDSIILVQNVRIFDGYKVLENASVLIKDGKIIEVGNKILDAKNIKIIDGFGKTLLPGLIDSHVHAWGDALKQCIVFGVTTVIDMFTDVSFVKEAKKKQATGDNNNVSDLFSAGTLATAPDGHGSEYGIKIPTIKNPEEAESFVNARISEGSDFIKIIYDDGSAFGTKLPSIDKQTLSALIDAAHKHNKLAIVHVTTLKFANDAIMSGADGLAHIFIDGLPEKNFYDMSIKNKTFFIPTLTVNKSLASVPFDSTFWSDSYIEPFISPNDLNSLRMTFSFTNKNLNYSFAESIIKGIKKAKLRILAGTDAPNPGTIYGGSLHQELDLLVKAGLTPLEVLSSATSIPAEIFNLSDRGRIAPGFRADMILVNGNPIENISATKDIVYIWKNGVLFNRDDYKNKIAKMKDEYKKEYSLPPPEGSESGKISDFEKGDSSAYFGFGWTPTSDVYAGGKSTAKINVTNEGAAGTKFSLKISGEISGGLMYAWGGALFYPGKKTFTPVNLSSKKEITFWAKGDNQTYSISFYTKDKGFIPISKKFKAESQWKQYTFSFKDFDGIDGHNLTGIGFTAGPTPGKFCFFIDEVNLK